MHCCISGNVTDEPVVSKASGNVYDKSLLEKYLIAEGKCPVTKEEMTMDDVVAIQAPKVVRPRPPAATSIPGMLSMFQDEWDAMMLETYTLKEHLDTARQELVKTLYQHDAACRVIARLVAERDEARFHLTQLQQAAPGAAAAPAAATNGGGAGAMDVEDASGGVPKAVDAAMQAKFEELQAMRKGRKAPATLASADDLGKYEVTATHPLHSTTKAGIKCLAVDPTDPTTLVTGGNDGQVICFDKESGKVKKTLKAHTKPVTSITAGAGALLSTSADKTTKVYVGSASEGSFDKGTLVKGVHSAEVTGLSLHPTGDYFATSSADGTWVFTDRASGKALLTVSDPGGAGGYTCIQFHPDGLLAGVGTAGGAVQIFDVRKQEVVATLPGHEGKVNSLCFSENGYYLASGGEDGIACCWDLRKLQKNNGLLKKLELGSGACTCVAFDLSGAYLAVGSDDVKVYKQKKWDLLATYGGHAKPVTAVAFGPDAQWVATASADRNLRFFGHAS